MGHNLNICRITSAFPPPWSGLAPGPYELSLAQVKGGHHVTVITKHSKGCEALDSRSPFQTYRIKATRNLIFSFFAAIKFILLHKKEKYDIIHSHGDSAIFLLLIKRLFFLKVPVVTSVHIVRKSQHKTIKNSDIYKIPKEVLGDEIIHELPPLSRNRRELFLEKLYITFSDYLVAVSEGIKKEIQNEYGKQNNISVILNGVDTAIFKEKQYGNDHRSNFHLLFVGVLNGRKGEFVLMKALNQVVAVVKNIQLMIIGNGPTKRIIVDMAKKMNLEKNIVFLENIPYGEMVKSYTESDVFILPSFSEGMPKVVLEAMACGCSIIATDIPGCRELVKDGRDGFLIPVNKPNALAEKILTFCREPHLIESMGMESRKVIENNYTWDNVAKRVEEGYKKIL